MIFLCRRLFYDDFYLSAQWRRLTLTFIAEFSHSLAGGNPGKKCREATNSELDARLCGHDDEGPG
jgi:hypothetical protein